MYGIYHTYTRHIPKIGAQFQMFENQQTCAGRGRSVAADADAANAVANAATPATTSDGGAASAPGGEGPAPAHSPGGKSGGAKAARGAVLRGVARPKADAD